MEHLPECIYKPEYWDVEQSILWNGKPCICDALRSCEQRVRKSLWQECYDAAMETTERNYVWHEKRGYAAALDAAEAAVADIRIDFPFDIRDVPTYGKKALAAIRALKGKP